ncbi:MAG: hypothetical protein ACOZNI_35950 [Myxococcota bacterium]
MLGLLAALAAPALAADVLVPEATPRSLDDFAVASLFYQLVVDAAREQGVDLEDADAIRKWAKAAGDGCYDNDACPGTLWSLTDARLAVVMSVGRTPAGLDVDVRLHGADDPAPFKVLRQQVAPGEEQAFASTVATAVKDALPLFPTRPKPLSLDEEEPEPTPPPEEEPEVAEVATPEPPPVPEAPPIRAVDDAEERRKMGVPAATYLAYKASGMPRAEWLEKARVRSGKVFVELGGGWAMGDVDRGYGVRVGVVRQGDTDDFVQEGISEWSGDGAGQAPGFFAAVGYAPTWFLETSVAGGGQFGQKHLSTGWECVIPEECEDDPTTPEDDTLSVYAPPSVQALQLVIEPRVRVVPLPTGVVKPYALVAFTLLYHDGFEVQDLEVIDYPDADGGASFGVTGGLGISIDAAAPFSFFAEVPATLLLSGDERVSTDPSLTQKPEPLEGVDTLIRFCGGISVRM